MDGGQWMHAMAAETEPDLPRCAPNFEIVEENLQERGPRRAPCGWHWQPGYEQVERGV